MTTAAFEGRCGPAVEGMPAAWVGLDDEAVEELKEKYYNDRKYRKDVGPSIELFGWDGEFEALEGLQLDIDFGHLGSVRGICREGAKVEFRTGPGYDEGSAFVWKTTGGGDYEILAWYFQERERPDSLDWLNKDCDVLREGLRFISQVQSAPKGIRFVSWKELYDMDALFDGINDEDKWWITLARLNDPKMAHHYGRASDAYPTLTVLLVILLKRYGYCSDGSEALPIIVTEENERVFDIADDMCRRITGTADYRCGWGNLIAFERIVEKIKSNYPSKKTKKDHKLWKDGYQQCQALMLVLSEQFEKTMWDYRHVDEPDRVEELIASFLLVFASFMRISSAPSDDARVQLEKDLDFNDQHLRAGEFFFHAKSEHGELFASTLAHCLKPEEDDGSD